MPVGFDVICRADEIIAPHLPVHLGSMSTYVRTQEEIWRGRLKRGDVIVSDHPDFGGTHLADATVIPPAFNGDNTIFYVASGAHHADIGGIVPGSMPPNSRELFQEGAAIIRSSQNHLQYPSLSAVGISKSLVP